MLLRGAVIKMKLFFVFLLISNCLFAKELNLKNDPGLALFGNSPSKSSQIVNHDNLLLLISDDFPLAKSRTLSGKFIKNENSSSRSAIDASLYRSISPSVVLILTKVASGSGSVISKDGLILTNYHVVENFKDVAVVFKPLKDAQKIQDSDIKRGKVIKVDQIADLAIIKVDDMPQGKLPIKLGDDSDIAVGIDVHAIGHPENQNWSYSKGIISQYRTNFKWTDYNQADVIQTQTPISHGSSGGPLLNDQGTLIGVNSFFNKNGQGLNFAVSIGDVKKFLSQSNDRFAPSKAAANLPTSVKAKCESKEIYRGKSKDGLSDVISIDTSCKGKIDFEYVYPLNKSDPMFVQMDRNGDGFMDVMVFSFKRDEKFDMSIWDTDFDRKWDTEGIHGDGTIKPTGFKPYVK
jgi:S1-C subfamily serine protease